MAGDQIARDTTQAQHHWTARYGDDPLLLSLVGMGPMAAHDPGVPGRRYPIRRRVLRRARPLDVVLRDRDLTVAGLDVGSTCTAIAQELNKCGNVTVLSNSLEALHVLRSPAVERLCVAGQINAEGSIIPHDIAAALEPYVLDKVILGCGGISASRGVTYHEVKETFFRRALIKRASEVILVADHAKLGRESSFSLGSLSLIDTLVTTREPEEPIAARLVEAGVQVEVVDVPESE